MYAEAGLLLPFSQVLCQEAPETHHYLLPLPDDQLLSRFNAVLPGDGAHMGNLVQTSTVSEYDLGGEGDLFKAPEPIIEEPLLALDPLDSVTVAAISMMSSAEDVITAETIKVADMESIQNEHLDNVLFECKKELLAKSAIEGPFASQLPEAKVPVVLTEETMEKAVERTKVDAEGPIQKSVSAGCLSSMEWINGCGVKPSFLDFQGLDFGAAFGMRRAYSENDIQTLGNHSSNNSSTSIVHSYLERQLTISDFKSEERREKLSRYRQKKSQRNFGRKIKYACRKALADSQPRVRGRFAKNDDSEIPKPSSK